MKGKKTTKATQPTGGQDFLPAGKMAKRLGLSGKTLLRWAAAKYITPRKLSRKTVLFSVAEVLAYVDSCKV